MFQGFGTNGQIISTYSGSSVPPPKIVSGNGVFLTFLSDIVVFKTGWTLSYTAYDATCTGTQTFTAASGLVRDRSYGPAYSTGVTCGFRISPTGATTFTIITLSWINFSVL